MYQDRSDMICKIQERLLDMGVGRTSVVHGVVATRWNEDEWEVGTWGTDDLMGSEHAAEEITDRVLG